MSDRSELRMNLAAIKRVDPYAKDIIDSSSHVAFYTFNSEESEWEKTDVEGAFFIYSRNAEPLYSIFINNRLNTNSFVEPLTGQLELQSQPPFLLYRNERSRIRGFWFYNSSECDRVGELVGKLIRDSGVQCNAKDNLEPRQSMINQDIFTMLSRAQNNFNKANCYPNISKNGSRLQLDGTSQSVMNFFASAKPAAASEVPLFQRLLSNPVSVDQIEKQQRATTPQNNIPATSDHDHETSQSVCVGAGNTAACMRNSGYTYNESQDPHAFQNKQEFNNHIQHCASSKPALMPPTMFLSTCTKKQSLNKENVIKESSEAEAVSKAIKKLEVTVEKVDTFLKPEPLTETQLLQAMLYLIKNDPPFIKKLHEAYLKSFNDMVS